MLLKLVRRFGRAVRCDVVGTGDKPTVKRSNAPGDEIGIRQVADPDGAVETFRYEIDEAVRVARVDV